jgi:hypothetical protein
MVCRQSGELGALVEEERISTDVKPATCGAMAANASSNLTLGARD